MDLSALQLDHFLTNGYLVIEDFFSPKTCEILMSRMAKIIDDHQQTIPLTIFSTQTNEHAATDYFLNSSDQIHFFFEPQAFDKNGDLLQPLDKSLNKAGHALHELDEVFHHFSYDERLKRYCQQLGFKTPCLLQSMYIFKQANIGAEVNCHQDATYLHTQNQDPVGFWFALQDATLENGCLQVLPCPHTTPVKKCMMRDDGQAIFFEEYDSTPWKEESCIPLEVRKGSLIMLHGRVPHKSNANLSNQSRHAYTLHAIDASQPYPASNWLRRRDGLPLWPLADGVETR